MKKIQSKVKHFCEVNQLDAPIEYRFLDLLSEMGELSKELLKMTDYGTKKLIFRPEFIQELGDVQYALITVANYFDIDLEQSVDAALIKYQKRLKNGSPGSENESQS